MSVQTSTSRPVQKSAGAAAVSVIISLAIFVFVFLGFLIAPLLALALAFLCYAVLRPRNDHPRHDEAQTGEIVAAPGRSAHGFGGGVQ